MYGTVVLPKRHVALFGGSIQEYAEKKKSNVPVFGGLPLSGRCLNTKETSWFHTN